MDSIKSYEAIDIVWVEEVSVTVAAPRLGKAASGVVASFPFMGAILAVFAYRQHGPVAAQQVLCGMVSGLFGFAVFFYALELCLGMGSMTVAYGVATGAALIVQGAFLFILTRRA